MGIKRIFQNNYKKMLWKNGKGVTTEVYRYPEGNNLNSFDWRISMASVKENGPFSNFEGYNRSIAILKGDGLLIKSGQNDWKEITRNSEVYNFSGDDETIGKLIQSEVEDFNIFTKRDKFKHITERFKLNINQNRKFIIPPHSTTTTTTTTILTHFGGELVFRRNSNDSNFEELLVNDGDSLVIDNYEGEINLSSTKSNQLDVFYTTITKI